MGNFANTESERQAIVEADLRAVQVMQQGGVSMYDTAETVPLQREWTGKPYSPIPPR